MGGYETPRRTVLVGSNNAEPVTDLLLLQVALRQVLEVPLGEGGAVGRNQKGGVGLGDGDGVAEVVRLAVDLDLGDEVLLELLNLHDAVIDRSRAVDLVRDLLGLGLRLLGLRRGARRSDVVSGPDALGTQRPREAPVLAGTATDAARQHLPVVSRHRGAAKDARPQKDGGLPAREMEHHRRGPGTASRRLAVRRHNRTPRLVLATPSAPVRGGRLTGAMIGTNEKGRPPRRATWPKSKKKESRKVTGPSCGPLLFAASASAARPRGARARPGNRSARHAGTS